MRAQISLLPTESKKLIARAVARMDIVQKALSSGIVALHPSSSTIFIVEELLGKLPDTEVWVCGVIAQKAACSSAESRAQRARDEADGRPRSPGAFPHTWVIEGGELKSGLLLEHLLDRMGHDDVYIKGANAIDVDNRVGVLIGNRVEGGTIGLVMSKSKRRGFKVVLPIGFEKLIPIPIEKAVKEAAQRNLLDYSMGIPCSLFPCEGIVVTDPGAIEILSGASAIPISAGGAGGAEGTITMLVKGDEEQVTGAIGYIEGVKGARLPREVRLPDCRDCHTERCSLRNADKPWC